MLAAARQDHEAILAERKAAGDPFLVTVMPGNRVFMDRTGLRESLRELHESNKNRIVLQVHGERCAGKSFSHELIDHLAGEYGFRRAGSSWMMRPARRMRWSKASQWTWPRQTPSRPSARVTRQVVRACLAMAGHQGEGAGWEWWFVIDGLNYLPPTSDVWDLVHKLALNVYLYGEGRVRLVLLGHDGIFDHQLDKRFMRDRVDPLTEEDVREFFANWFGYLNERLPKAKRLDQAQIKDQVEDTVTQVLDFAHAQAEEPGRTFMHALAEAVEEAVDATA